MGPGGKSWGQNADGPAAEQGSSAPRPAARREPGPTHRPPAFVSLDPHEFPSFGGRPSASALIKHPWPHSDPRGAHDRPPPSSERPGKGSQNKAESLPCRALAARAYLPAIRLRTACYQPVLEMCAGLIRPQALPRL